MPRLTGENLFEKYILATVATIITVVLSWKFLYSWRENSNGKRLTAGSNKKSDVHASCAVLGNNNTSGDDISITGEECSDIENSECDITTTKRHPARTNQVNEGNIEPTGVRCRMDVSRGLETINICPDVTPVTDYKQYRNSNTEEYVCCSEPIANILIGEESNINPIQQCSSSIQQLEVDKEKTNTTSTKIKHFSKQEYGVCKDSSVDGVFDFASNDELITKCNDNLQHRNNHHDSFSSSKCHTVLYPQYTIECSNDNRCQDDSKKQVLNSKMEVIRLGDQRVCDNNNLEDNMADGHFDLEPTERSDCLQSERSDRIIALLSDSDGDESRSSSDVSDAETIIEIKPKDKDEIIDDTPDTEDYQDKNCEFTAAEMDDTYNDGEQSLDIYADAPLSRITEAEETLTKFVFVQQSHTRTLLCEQLTVTSINRDSSSTDAETATGKEINDSTRVNSDVTALAPDTNDILLGNGKSKSVFITNDDELCNADEHIIPRAKSPSACDASPDTSTKICTNDTPSSPIIKLLTNDSDEPNDITANVETHQFSEQVTSSDERSKNDSIIISEGSSDALYENIPIKEKHETVNGTMDSVNNDTKKYIENINSSISEEIGVTNKQRKQNNSTKGTVKQANSPDHITMLNINNRGDSIQRASILNNKSSQPRNDDLTFVTDTKIDGEQSSLPINSSDSTGEREVYDTVLSKEISSGSTCSNNENSNKTDSRIEEVDIRLQCNVTSVNTSHLNSTTKGYHNTKVQHTQGTLSESSTIGTDTESESYKTSKNEDKEDNFNKRKSCKTKLLNKDSSEISDNRRTNNVRDNTSEQNKAEVQNRNKMQTYGKYLNEENKYDDKQSYLKSDGKSTVGLNQPGNYHNSNIDNSTNVTSTVESKAATFKTSKARPPSSLEYTPGKAVSLDNLVRTHSRPGSTPSSPSVAPKGFFFDRRSCTSLLETDLDTMVTTAVPLVTKTDMDDILSAPPMRASSMINLRSSRSDTKSNRPSSVLCMPYRSNDTVDTCQPHRGSSSSDSIQKINQSLEKLNIPDWLKYSNVKHYASTGFILGNDRKVAGLNSGRSTPTLPDDWASSDSTPSGPRPVIIQRSASSLSRSNYMRPPVKYTSLTPTKFELPSAKLRKSTPKELLPIKMKPFKAIVTKAPNIQQTKTSEPYESTPSEGQNNKGASLGRMVRSRPIMGLSRYTLPEVNEKDGSAVPKPVIMPTEEIPVIIKHSRDNNDFKDGNTASKPVDVSKENESLHRVDRSQSNDIAINQNISRQQSSISNDITVQRSSAQLNLNGNSGRINTPPSPKLSVRKVQQSAKIDSQERGSPNAVPQILINDKAQSIKSPRIVTQVTKTNDECMPDDAMPKSSSKSSTHYSTPIKQAGRDIFPVLTLDDSPPQNKTSHSNRPELHVELIETTLDKIFVKKPPSETDSSLEAILDGLLDLSSPKTETPPSEGVHFSFDGTSEKKDDGEGQMNDLYNFDFLTSNADVMASDDEITKLFEDENVEIKCRNTKCGKTAKLVDARACYKACHHCYTYYCSRECRKRHWPRHKKKCLQSKLSSACKHIITSIRKNAEQFSRIARTGFLSKGRGYVQIIFEDLESTQQIINNNIQGASLSSATYISLRDLEESSLATSETAHAKHIETLTQQCKTYNPEFKFVLNVGIQPCFSDTGSTPASSVSNDSMSLSSGGSAMVQKSAKVNLSSAQIRPQPKPDRETLILTAVPGAEITENMDLRKAREICFIHIQRKLRQRGVSLRHQYPDIYSRLCAYVDTNEPFTPIDLYPVDKRTGKRFVCLIMPNSDPELDWLIDSDLLDELGLSNIGLQ